MKKSYAKLTYNGQSFALSSVIKAKARSFNLEGDAPPYKN